MLTFKTLAGLTSSQSPCCGHEHTKAPKIVVTNVIFLHLILLVMYRNHILDFFAYFKYI